MEAAVLNLALMPEMVVDCNSNTLNAELEVKKLQALVRKLERQNEQLRTRTQPLLPASPPPYALLTGRTEDYRWSEVETRGLEYLEPSVREDGAGKVNEEEDDIALLDDLELLDLDSMCASSSGDSLETWLYNTQRSADSSDSALTPLQWCRQTLDSPKSELEATRRSLSLRLEQVSRWRSSLSSPSHSSSPSPSLSRVSGMSPISASPSAKPCSTPQSERHGRSLQRSLFSPQPSVDEEESVCVGFKLQDLTDVQVMSLRQELAFPARRSHSLSSFPLSAGAPPGREEEDDEEEDDEDYALLPPPAPRLTRLPHSHTFHTLSHWAGGTPSPLHRSAGFTFHMPELQSELEQELGPCADRAYAPGSDKLRRSMPNLVRAPSMPSVPLPPSPSASPRASPCLLRSSHSFDLSSGLSRLHSSIPAPAPLQSRVQSLGSFCASRPTMKATAYVSPTIKSSAYLTPPTTTSPSSPGVSGLSGIPLPGKHTGFPTPPRSALPRPASFIAATSSAPRSKLAQPGRSFLTPPKSLSTLSALRDSSTYWRDGCY